MGVSKNRGTPKASILIGFCIINHPFWGPTPIFGNTRIFKIFGGGRTGIGLEDSLPCGALQSRSGLKLSECGTVGGLLVFVFSNEDVFFDIFRYFFGSVRYFIKVL